MISGASREEAARGLMILYLMRVEEDDPHEVEDQQTDLHFGTAKGGGPTDTAKGGGPTLTVTRSLK